MKRYLAFFKTGLLFSSLFLLLIPRASASYGHECVVVAWDEEYAAAPGTLLYMYTWAQGIVPLTARTYNDWQWSRVLYHFHNKFGTYVNLEVIGSVQFHSTNTGTLPDTLYEAIEQTGFRNGIYFNGKRATILMVWTLQNNDNLGGGCLPSERAFIVKYQTPWADDNTILHELTHLWIGDESPADTPHGNCLMSSEECYVGFYNEPLQPDWGHVILALFQTVAYGYISYDWCPECTALMENHLSHTYPPPLDPWIEGLHDNPTGRILLFLGIVIIAVVIVYLLNRFGKLKKTRIVKDQSSDFRLFMFCIPLISMIKFLEDQDHERPYATQHRVRYYPMLGRRPK